MKKLNNTQEEEEYYCPILPGLPDDLAKYCLALVPRTCMSSMSNVCKQWRSFIQNKEFIVLRKEARKVEEWVYFLTVDEQGKRTQWEVSSFSGKEPNHRLLPPMPGPVKFGFGIAVFDGKLLVIAGYAMDESKQEQVSSDVYQYDSRLDRWSMLANLNVGRREFACAEVGGLVYVAGGYGLHGESISSVEVYSPENKAWVLIQNLPRSRWSCFGCGVGEKLYVMGGRSRFTIGSSRYVDIYDPKNKTWCQNKNGCVMVTAYAVLGDKLFCMEWKDQRKIAVFDFSNNSWKKVSIPVMGNSCVKLCFGTFNGKLLLFSSNMEREYETLVYDPKAPTGLEWKSSASFKPPPRSCLRSVTIHV